MDPQKDYDAFLARSADADTTLPTENDAAFDGSGAGFTDQTLVMACTSQVEPTVNDATYFVVTASFHATDLNGNGTLDFSDTDLTIPPTTITNIASGAATATVPGNTVTNGQASVNFGPTNVPAAGSPLGAQIDFSETTLYVRVQGGTLLCANLGGVVTEPDQTPLTPSENICVFAPPGPGGAVPTFTQMQFQCTPPGDL